MSPEYAIATADEAPAIFALRVAVAEDLTRRHGRGHWSSTGTVRGVLHSIRTSRAILARDRGELLGMLRLQTKKPWAIDPSYFAAVKRPLYVVDLAVSPAAQRSGIGRGLIAEARSRALDWPAQALRLDAYDHAAGAGAFYSKCGFHEVGRVVYRAVPLVYFEWLTS